MSHDLWLSRLRDDILPVMRTYYEHAGVELVTGREWLREMKDYMEMHPPPRAVESLAKRAERQLPDEREILTPRTIVHGDLHPDNVHWHDGSWWLIDWAVSRRMGMLFDVLARAQYFLIRELPVDQLNGFWCWMRGEESYEAVSSPIRNYLECWKQEQKAWVEQQLLPDAIRFQLLMMWLELASFRSGEERVEDYRSPEAVLKNVLKGMHIGPSGKQK
jgi:thiamine kinase-like enzyme